MPLTGGNARLISVLAGGYSADFAILLSAASFLLSQSEARAAGAPSPAYIFKEVVCWLTGWLCKKPKKPKLTFSIADATSFPA